MSDEPKPTLLPRRGAALRVADDPRRPVPPPHAAGGGGARVSPLRRLAVLLAAVSWLSVASAEPRVGQAIPPFAVDDLEGQRRTARDLLGGYTVVFAMTDLDARDPLAAWRRPLQAAVPPGTRMVTLRAFNLFALIPDVVAWSRARTRTPRAQWGAVWLSIDGSLARSLGLPESETPWVFVVDPGGRVLASAHAQCNPADLARLVAAIPHAE